MHTYTKIAALASAGALAAAFVVGAEGVSVENSAKLVTYPAPPEEVPSPEYRVTVNGKPVFVYQAKVRQTISKPPDSIWTHELGAPGEIASFAYFDFAGPVTVKVDVTRAFASALLHPRAAGVPATVQGKTVTFTLDRPRQLTLLLDGKDDRPLHLFANPLETDVPKPGDPKVLYFGPGTHRIGTTRVTSGQTVYIAGGAVVKGELLPDEKGQRSKLTGLTHYAPVLHISEASQVRVRGRGILDGGDLPHGAKSTLSVDRCSDVEIEGIIIRDSSSWAITLNRSENVTVANVKEINGRLNSDGINPVNSRHIRIRDCFIRNHDDSIAVKTTNPDAGEASDILVERCVIWNDWGYGLGITYETRAPIHDVTFRDCDVLTALNWALGIHVVDSATISAIRFENIRVENTRSIFIRLGVTSDMWGKDPNRGHIRGVVFQDVSYTGADTPPSEILGHDAEHKVEDVALRGLRIGGKAVPDAAAGRFNINAHTAGIRFE